MIKVILDTTSFRASVSGILAQAKRPVAILAGIGRELGNLLKQHFRAKDKSDASYLGTAGGRRQHFWLKVGETVNAPTYTGTDGAMIISITISHPAIAQKVHGGTIVAKRVKNLAIPVSPEAYGRTPATFERETGFKLFVLREGGTEANSARTLILASRRGYGKDLLSQLHVEYVLKHSVTQRPDPTALPDEAMLEAKLTHRGQSILDRQLASLT